MPDGATTSSAEGEKGASAVKEKERRPGHPLWEGERPTNAAYLKKGEEGMIATISTNLSEEKKKASCLQGERQTPFKGRETQAFESDRKKPGSNTSFLPKRGREIFSLEEKKKKGKRRPEGKKRKYHANPGTTNRGKEFDFGHCRTRKKFSLVKRRKTPLRGGEIAGIPGKRKDSLFPLEKSISKREKKKVYLAKETTRRTIQEEGGVSTFNEEKNHWRA